MNVDDFAEDGQHFNADFRSANGGGANDYYDPVPLSYENSQERLREDIQRNLEGGDYDNLFELDLYDVQVVQDPNVSGSALNDRDRSKFITQLNEDPPVQAPNFSMPGAFKMNQDSMELDGGTPLTLQLDFFPDSMLETDVKFEDEYVNSNNNYGPLASYQGPSPNFGSNVEPSEINMINNRGRSDSGVSFLPQNGELNNHLRNASIDSHSAIQNPNSLSNHSLSISNNFYNELSPLTTTTSMTPSVSSVHSNQPSFFSAQQYFTRNSMDQPPSQSHRPSFDLYGKNRNSIDSQQSSIHQRNQTDGGRYSSFTNSISNYIPFMGDRNSNRSSRAPVGSPSSTPSNSRQFAPERQPQQSKHIIRSIFKSSNISSLPPEDVNENTDDVENTYEPDGTETDLMITSPTREEDSELIDNNNVPKKARRTKRSLFTRFKGPVKSEPVEGSDFFRNDDNLFKTGEHESNYSSGSAGQVSISQTPSSSFTSHNVAVTALDPSVLSGSANYNQTALKEPDYAALFEKVGKRKNIVKPANYIKSKSKSKGDLQPEFSSQSESSTFLNSSFEKSLSQVEMTNKDYEKSVNSSSNSSLLGYENNRDDFDLSSNGSESGNAKDPGLDHQQSILTAASKRKLGSKLMPKKKNAVANPNVATIITKGVEVEVDLKSLDLPPNTQIFPTSIINSKNRTRGRKENKEADLVDLSKIYLCNYCSRRFKRQEHLKRHFRSLHTFEKPYDCSICHKKFSRLDNLNQHLKVHKQEEDAMNELAGS
ncbi:uncharacterized protein PRCAT00002016001 [Priceomyces carsonii]|uniref:uncharacterized protein n=1 Tax=Priceomyces carsonii TaxID=28549 RepID=UPI002EDAD81F|nr:unnamed protein product [Priceomyces carsonii]